ncbi:antitoxin [Tomitella biformata]|uniref:antitoxin n=1 Tax=Tomitella biformata TaxID=630403 RepID=UPI0004638E8F|nr:antitoxin [Tomitella biformata]
MGIADQFKGAIGKAKDLAVENADKIEGAVDKAGDFIDDKTGGKYADKVDTVQDAVKKNLKKD